MASNRIRWWFNSSINVGSILEGNMSGFKVKDPVIISRWEIIVP
jgi:hypothetical protein